MAISTQWRKTVSPLAVVWCSHSLQFIDIPSVICNSTNLSFHSKLYHLLFGSERKLLSPKSFAKSLAVKLENRFLTLDIIPFHNLAQLEQLHIVLGSK